MADQTPANKPLVPTITGNPVYDAMIGSAIMVVAGPVTGYLVAKGWLGDDPVKVAATVVGGLTMIATIAWRYVQTRKTRTAIADHTMTAIATGIIPDSVMKEAVKAPSVSETKIETAVNNAAVIKDAQ